MPLEPGPRFAPYAWAKLLFRPEHELAAAGPHSRPTAVDVLLVRDFQVIRRTAGGRPRLTVLVRSADAADRGRRSRRRRSGHV